jgi:hypothetical protein
MANSMRMTQVFGPATHPQKTMTSRILVLNAPTARYTKVAVLAPSSQPRWNLLDTAGLLSSLMVLLKRDNRIAVISVKENQVDEDKEKTMTELINDMFSEIQHLKKRVAELESGQKSVKTEFLRATTMGNKIAPSIGDLFSYGRRKDA